MDKHTAKPWHKEDSREGGFDIIAENGDWIATVHGGRDEDEPDSDLIITSPNLLEACEDAMAGLTGFLIVHKSPAIEAIVDNLAKIISKATGRGE